jgi:hypothetical protein
MATQYYYTSGTEEGSGASWTDVSDAFDSTMSQYAYVHLFFIK